MAYNWKPVPDVIANNTPRKRKTISAIDCKYNLILDMCNR
jgi:hypothetical protein